MKHWSHRHSLAAGGLITLTLLRGHQLELLTAVFAAGVLAGLFWQTLRRGLFKSSALVGAQLRILEERAGEIRARRRGSLERSRELRTERERREAAAYWRGVRDGTP